MKRRRAASVRDAQGDGHALVGRGARTTWRRASPSTAVGRVTDRSAGAGTLGRSAATEVRTESPARGDLELLVTALDPHHIGFDVSGQTGGDHSAAVGAAPSEVGGGEERAVAAGEDDQ